MKTKIFQNIIKNDEKDLNKIKSFTTERLIILEKETRTKLLADAVEKVIDEVENECDEFPEIFMDLRIKLSELKI